MRRIIIATHHQLAQGMADTLTFLSGYPHIDVLCAYVDERNVDESIAELMQTEAEETFIFTDMLGGSVTQKFTFYQKENVHLICGMNLPLVLTIALAGEECIPTERIHEMIEEAKASIIYVNQYQSITLEEDE